MNTEENCEATFSVFCWNAVVFFSATWLYCCFWVSISQFKTKVNLQVFASVVDKYVNFYLPLLQNSALSNHPWRRLHCSTVDTAIPKRRPGHPKQFIPGKCNMTFSTTTSILQPLWNFSIHSHFLIQNFDCRNCSIIYISVLPENCCSSLFAVRPLSGTSLWVVPVLAHKGLWMETPLLYLL